VQLLAVVNTIMNDLYRKRQDGLEDIGVDDRVTLNCILKKRIEVFQLE